MNVLKTTHIFEAIATHICLATPKSPPNFVIRLTQSGVFTNGTTHPESGVILGPTARNLDFKVINSLP